MRERRLALGLDFGTESARAVLVDLRSGQETAAVSAYRHGVIDRALPSGRRELPPDFALQDPGDYLASAGRATRAALRAARARPGSVAGIGVSFTSCTMLPVDRGGAPLCLDPGFAREPHAWVKLWKHHGAIAEAEEITATARRRREPFLAGCGGTVSSEWMLPKMLETLRRAPRAYAAAAAFLEGGDWVVAWLTGSLGGPVLRSACNAGYKAQWTRRHGYPSRAFLRAVDRRFARAAEEKLRGEVRPPGERAGLLAPGPARRLGLPAGIPVAVGMIDAHAAALGAGLARPGQMVMVMGTSTCHMTVSPLGRVIPGIPGVVEDGIVPGLFGYEAGQPAVGDLFAWFVRHAAPGSLGKDPAAVHRALAERAAALPWGRSGLLALDWWNGNRSTLMNAGLSGLIAGLTLGTRPEEIYRALLEATAFGTRRILDTLARGGVRVTELRACGGLPERNRLLPQIYADVTGREIRLAASPQASALGAAILGSVAAGREGGGFPDIPAAAARLARVREERFRPDRAAREVCSRLYRLWTRLHDRFGLDDPDLMAELRRLRAL